VPGLVSLPRLPTLHPDQSRASTVGDRAVDHDLVNASDHGAMPSVTNRTRPHDPAGSRLVLAIERLKGDTSVATLRLVGPRHRPVARWAFQDLSSANSAASSKVLSGHPAPVRPGQEGHHVGDVGGLSDPAERTHTGQRGEVIGTVGAAKQVGVGGAG
jgi:hypothetical protein